MNGFPSYIKTLAIFIGLYFAGRAAAQCSSYYVDNNGKCTDMRWCRYRLYLNARNWTEAKAICKQENRRLLHISDQSQHDYLTSLIATSLSSIGVATEYSSFWIGLFRSQGGVSLWQDNCQAAGGGSYANSNTNEYCFLLQPKIHFKSQECNARQPFICEDTAATFDDMTCYTQAPTMHDAIIRSISYKPGPSTACHPFCSASECVGYRIVSGSCVMLNYASGMTYFKGGTDKYAKAITITSSVDITNPVPSISDICKVIPVLTTTAISPSSTFNDVLIDSTSQSLITYISLDKTASVSPESSLESSMASLVQSEITYERTPELSTDFTTIHLETTDPKTDMYTNDVTSHACPDCGCNSNHMTSVSPEELQSMIDELKEELTVKKEDLSSWKRKLISVPDDRVSAKSIGYFGAGLLAAVFGAIVLIDLPRFIRSAKSVFRAIHGQGGHNRQIYDVS